MKDLPKKSIPPWTDLVYIALGVQKSSSTVLRTACIPSNLFVKTKWFPFWSVLEIYVFQIIHVFLSGRRIVAVCAILRATVTSISIVGNIRTVHTIDKVNANCVVPIHSAVCAACAGVTFHTNDVVHTVSPSETSTRFLPFISVSPSTSSSFPAMC